MSDDGESAAEGISRLQKIRQQKSLEDFLSKVDAEFKPVIDTEKDRHISDHAILELTAMQHVERLSGKNAFVGYKCLCTLYHSSVVILYYYLLVEKSQPFSCAHASRNCFG